MATGSEFPGRADLEPQALREFAHRAVDWIVDYLTEFHEEPILQPAAPREVFAAFDEPLPREGLPVDTVLREFEDRVARYATHLQHPGNFAYIPNSASLLGIMADALASTLNQNVSLVRGGPSAAAVEERVVSWLREWLGYPEEGGGVLTSGGSSANLMGLALARDRAGGGEELIFYTSSEVHSSIDRALRFLGVPRAAVRVLATDDQYRLDPHALRDAVAEDRSTGRVPGVVVATAGTIASGAVDPLQTIGDLCEQEGMWLHVDGAYGALAAVAPGAAWMREGLARAHSLSLDPHKWLFVPIDASCLLVRDPEHMRRFFTVVPEYLKVGASELAGDIHHPMEHTFELTRRFRALKLWMTLKACGASVLQEKIETHLAMARQLASWVEVAEGFELLAPVMTSTVCFRRVPDSIEKIDDLHRSATLDRLNEEIMDRVNRRGGLFLSRGRLGGVFALRVCITHLRTREDDLRHLWTSIQIAAAQVERELGLA